jgi:F-type H+-transporting ATPase subunit epsilon
MILEIVTPEATLFSGEVTSVAVPGIEGEFQMLNNHAAVVSVLMKGNVKITADKLNIPENLANRFQKINEKTVWLAIESGTVEMNQNKVIVLAD